MNSVQLTGRFTKDPVVTYTDGGSTIARFNIATDRRFKREGEQSADFISCVAFGRTAEFIEKYFYKGMKIELNGRIQTGSYTNKDGIKVYTTDVIAENVSFAESKSAGASSREDGFGQAPRTSDVNDGFMSIPDGLDDEELPFN